MKKHRQCIICHSRTQELDSTGRCRCCANVKAAHEAGISYGKYMAQKYARDAGEGNVGR